MYVNISISLLRLSVFLLLCITILHACATVFYWYWSIDHFDTIMHGLGGFWVFLFFASFFLGDNIQEYTRILHSKKWIIIIGVMGIAFGWEMIEWFFDAIIYRQNLWQPHTADSIKDFFAGLSGAGLSYIFIRYFLIKKSS